MQIKLRDSQEFTGLIQGLATDIVNASIHFRLYRDLHASIPEYARELNQAPAFWGLAIQAQLDVALIRLCRSYDSEKKALSLVNWIDTIKEHLKVFETPNFRERLRDNPFVESLSEVDRVPSRGQLDADRRLVVDDDPLVKRLIRWRNNIGAHRNAKEILEPGRTVSEPLTLDEVTELLERAVRILNTYSSLFQAVTYSTQMVGADDFKYVPESVRQRIEEAERRFHEELQKYEDQSP